MQFSLTWYDTQVSLPVLSMPVCCSTHCGYSSRLIIMSSGGAEGRFSASSANFLLHPVHTCLSCVETWISTYKASLHLQVCLDLLHLQVCLDLLHLQVCLDLLHKLTNVMYKTIYELHTRNMFRSPWLVNVENILTSVVWLTCGSVNARISTHSGWNQQSTTDYRNSSYSRMKP